MKKEVCEAIALQPCTSLFLAISKFLILLVRGSSSPCKMSRDPMQRMAALKLAEEEEEEEGGNRKWDD